MTTGIAITGSGTFFPEPVLNNEELCAAFNAYVRAENARRAEAIAAGTAEPLAESSPEFITKASGIRERHIWDKSGVLDPERMCPNIPDRPDAELCVQAEMAVKAAEVALERAGRCGEDIDMVMLATANLQRLYPAIAMEVQDALGARGFAYDLTVGCSSGTYPIQIATDALRSGNATCALIVNPELMSGHANWRDRDSHFIFGDAATALVLEPAERARPGAFEILGTRLMSKFSSNIRNNGGYLNRCDPEHQFDPDKLFYQQGRKVFKDVVPMASHFMTAHLEALGIEPQRIARFWLHQANINMNDAIMRRILGGDPPRETAPIVLDRYGNTASTGSIIAFDHYHDDLPSASHGVLCSFGAGYSIGSVVLKRL